MAVPSYTTDLTVIDEANTLSASWVEPTGFADGALAIETENYIQATGAGANQAIGKNFGAGAIRLVGAMYNYGSGASIPSPGGFLTWIYCANPAALQTQANGGMQVFVGQSGSAFRQYYVRGRDTYQYGGWVCIPVDPTVLSDANTGTPNTTYQYFGGAVVSRIAVSKGDPFYLDVMRFGRCEARFANGSTADGYATFAGFSANNDLEANRWGLLQAIPGGYLNQGLIVFGYANPVDFRDTGVNITIADTQKVTADFNTIEVRQATSNVFLTSCQFTALGTTSKGRWVSTDDANVQLTTCTFNNMGTFDFKPKANLVSCTFNNCGQITLSNAHFTSCRVSGSTVATNTSALVWDNNLDAQGYLDGCTFVRGTANNHAIEFGTSSPTTLNLVGLTFSGYNASQNTNDSAIHFKRTSGQIDVYSPTTPSYSTEGATIVMHGTSVTVAVATKDVDGVDVNDARVFLKASASGHGLPYDATVTIVNTGTSANVHHTGHGMATNDKVLIDGASHWQNNGVFQITKIDDNYYNYTLPSAPGSDPTGTIKATYVALEGTTSSGAISTGRVYSEGLPVVGWARKSSSAPYYKTAPLTGTVNATTGFTATAIMILDQ